MNNYYQSSDNVPTRTSAYDLLSAWLTSLIMLIGFLVASLFLIWLTSVFKYETNVGAIPETLASGEDGNDKPKGFEDDALDPGVEDFAEVDTPQLAEALEAVSDAVSTIQANSELVHGTAKQMGTGGGFGNRDGGPKGPGGGIPDYERWKITFEVDSIDTYKRQLDHFGISVGVYATGAEDVWKVSDIVAGGEVSKTDRSSQKGVLGFSNERIRTRKWDQQIARNSGIDLEGKELVQFYTQETRALIAQVEAEYLKNIGRELKDVTRTNLRIEASGSGFEFKVVGCVFR